MNHSALSRILFNAIFSVIGASLYGFSYLIKEEVVAKPLNDFGLIILSSSLIFFIFSWITERHQLDVTERTVGKYINIAVKDIFQRIGIRTMSTVWADYRWDCWLYKSLGEKDPYTSYNVQQFNYQFSHSNVPEKIDFVIGYSNDNDAAKEYYADPNCLLVWEMSWLPSQPIQLDDEHSHRMDYLEINGERMECTINKDADMKGGAAYKYHFKVPRKFIGQRCDIAFSFFVRKIASTDNTINVITRLKEDCDDAEFKLHLDSDLEATELFVYTTEVTPLIERFGYDTEHAFLQYEKKPRAGYARFKKLLQKGSNIRFEVRIKSN